MLWSRRAAVLWCFGECKEKRAIVHKILAPARTTPEIVLLILETPAIRSSQDTETSFMHNPDKSARICISTVQPQVRSLMPRR